MKVSIIVPAFNEEKLLGESLRAIAQAACAFHARGWEVERIVCDNNSTDRTADVARAEGAAVVFEPVNQIGRARNRGAAAASGDWLLFIDADSQPSRGLLDAVAESILSDRYIAGGSTVRGEPGFPDFAVLLAMWNAISRATGWFAGSFIFCEAKAFHSVGGFSGEFFVAEELDLSRRLQWLARVRKKRTVVLTGHPIVTSARKMRLYRRRERVRFLFDFVRSRGRAVREQARCGIWYDGRR